MVRGQALVKFTEKSRMREFDQEFPRRPEWLGLPSGVEIVGTERVKPVKFEEGEEREYVRVKRGEQHEYFFDVFLTLQAPDTAALSEAFAALHKHLSHIEGYEFV